MNPTDEQLRPALELAFAVAVAGQRLKPAIPAPSPLKAFLKFQKLPASALPVVRKVVDEDDEFRARVAAVAEWELIGELPTVWLTRSEGWADQVRTLADEASDESAATGPSADTGPAKRKRLAAEHAARKARAELSAAREEAERERARRRAAERVAAEASQQVEDLERQLGLARGSAERAKERSANSAADAERAHEKNRALLDRIRDLERILDEALIARTDAETRADDLERTVRTLNDLATTAPSSPADSAVPAPSPRGLDQAAGALSTTAGALRDLAAALDATSGALRPRLESDESPNRLDDGLRHWADAVQGTRPLRPGQPGAVRRSEPRRDRRAALPMPGGVFEDSVEGADHLLRQTGAMVIVDGYNVAKLGWPNLTLEHQRDAAVSALEDLTRRAGTRIVVIFDGSDVVRSVRRRSLVRVRFSTPGETADDAIRRLVDDLDPGVAVVVVTNDQEIVRDVRRAGANVVSSDHLLTVAKR
ncbi:MAG: NYN domain-containing protein [Ilumatobacteraceae bacterium]